MRDEIYLVFTEEGFLTKATKKPPNVGAGQFPIRIRLSVPDQLFHQAIPDLDVNIPESATLTPVYEADLSAMDDVCLNTVMVALPRDHGENYRCPECGYATWSKTPGPHYKPGVIEEEA